jgi:hypothetical protein
MVMVVPKPRNSTDEPLLSESLRSLAGEVRRLGNLRGSRGPELASVSSRLHAIRLRVAHLPHSPLHRWIDSLAREIENLNIAGDGRSPWV